MAHTVFSGVSSGTKDYWDKEAAKLDTPSRALECLTSLAQRPEVVAPYKKENDAN